MTTNPNSFNAKDTFTLADGTNGTIYRLSALEKAGHVQVSKLPYSIRVLLEGALRNHDGFLIEDADACFPYAEIRLASFV